MPLFHTRLIHEIKKPEHEQLLKRLADDYLVRMDRPDFRPLRTWCNEYSPNVRFVKEQIKYPGRNKELSRRGGCWFSVMEGDTEKKLKEAVQPPMPNELRREHDVTEGRKTPTDFFDLVLSHVQHASESPGTPPVKTRLILIKKNKLKESQHHTAFPYPNDLVVYPEERVVVPVGRDKWEMGDRLPEEICEFIDLDEKELNKPITQDEREEALRYITEAGYSGDPDEGPTVEAHVGSSRMYKLFYNQLIAFAKKRYGA